MQTPARPTWTRLLVFSRPAITGLTPSPSPRSDAALAQRDLPRPLATRRPSRRPPAPGPHPLLQHLLHASTPTLAASRVHAIDLEGDGRHELVTFTPGVAGDAVTVHAMDPWLCDSV